MSGVEYYGALLGDEDRVRAFDAGIRSVVRPGDRVLDLGTGIGTYALFAARAGAAEVWAVDRDPIVHVAETIAAANGLAGVVRFVRGSVPGADLPGRFDVLVFEDFPVPLFDRRAWELLRRVQADNLSERGTMVPGAARLSLAPLGSDELRDALFPGPAGGGERYGLDWGALDPLLANTPRRVSVPEGWVMAPPIAGERLPLCPPPPAERLALVGSWRAGAGGRVDALALWFDLETAPGTWVTNAPGLATAAWGQWALPVRPSLYVAAGMDVRVAVRREILDGGVPGWLTWEIEAGGEARRGHEFAGLLVDAAELGTLPPVPR